MKDGFGAAWSTLVLKCARAESKSGSSELDKGPAVYVRDRSLVTLCSLIVR